MRLWKMIRYRLQRTEVYAQASFWDEKAEDYAGRAASMWPNSVLNRHLRHEQFGCIQRILPKIGGWRVLDIGCGTGDLSRYFAERGAQVVGVDFSARALAWARRQQSAPIEYVQGSAFDLQGMKDFDLAVTLALVTVACKSRHDVERLLGRVFQVLKPGGRLLVMEPLHRGLLRRVLDMETSEFRECLERCGFRVIAAESLHFWPTRVLLAHIQWPRWVTVPLIRLGLRWMRRHGRCRMGDYQALLAIRP